MSILPIRKYGDPVLRQKCEPVKEITPEVRQLIRDMIETMYAAPGAGLAANQVGVPVSLVIIDVAHEGKHRPMVLINPRIVAKNEIIKDEEGCLSMPGLNALVKRYKNVRVEATNEKGFPVVVEGSDMLARALQHEIDHLEGKLYIDHLSLIPRKRLEAEIRRKRKEAGW